MHFAAGVALAALIVAGCGGPTSTPTPTPTASPPPTPGPSTPPPAAHATLVVTADGTVKCRLFPHGCLASLIIVPIGNWSPPAVWEPAEDTPSFGARPDPWELDGASPFFAPTLIAPGEYTFAIGISEINDIADDPDRYLMSEVKCIVPVLVTDDVKTVTLHFDLDAQPCANLSLETN